ncbi:HDOD domain-containing protein [Neptuniibacter halophilus]|uniref:HDOD domain-containing protein n=1 Tax=Neptuniibacter halophilus TaxID=651666 RepID=UPI002572AECE|nr:HDOD domain-containing protein [Neptuniibacter halophilus]
MKYTETLKNIHRSLDRLGDLPVFSATVNRIQQISASEESDAMALAMAIMKDASLSARLLKLANSPVYKRGQGNISVVSRAVVLMGFNQIKNICLTLKLIESFHDEHPDLDVPGMMMRQFLSANIAKELAMRGRQNVDPEEAYIGALLFGLGEIMVACTLPDQYRKMLRLKQQGEKKWPLIQAEVLGISFCELGREMAAGWGYPKQVLSIMSPVDIQHLDERSDMLSCLPFLSNGLVQQIYGQDPQNEQPFDQLVDAISNVGNIPHDDVAEVTLQCFRQVAKVSRTYGLKTKALIPEFSESGNVAKDDIVRQLAFLARSEAEEIEAESEPEPVMEDHSAGQRSAEQLDYLNRLTALIASEGKIHEVFKLVVEAIRHCSQFDRSMLCLLDKSRMKLSVKMLEGESTEPLQTYFERSKNGRADDLFFRVLDKQVTLLVNDLDEEGWRKRLPEQFVKSVGCQGFVLIPLTMGKRVIGMLYADRLATHGPISEEDFNTFSHFATQTRLALMYADSKTRQV